MESSKNNGLSAKERVKVNKAASESTIVESYFLAGFSIGMILLSAAILSFLLYKASTTVRSQDNVPELHSLTPEKVESFGGSPAVVQVGLYIKDFTEFDMLTNKFTFSGILWFLFDPSIISLDTLSKFSFQKGQIIYQSPPNTRIVEGKLLARYDIRVSLKTTLVYSLFPFESHVIHITLDNNAVTPGELVFESSNNNITVSPDVATTGWRLTETEANAGYSFAQLEKQPGENDVYHPRLVFSLEYAHTGLRQPLTILLPLILIFYMAIFSLAMNREKSFTSILALSTASVTALLAYRFVIENLAPKVGYFMLSDSIFFLLLIATCIVFFINMSTVRLTTASTVFLIVALHALVIGTFFYLLTV